ncbi:hypothetical protein HDU97_002367 [Phlyctochytrium planicorne]|nr:hypothetical protein HDU97_002367 [Phlyctochytrium planicorne]
MATSPSDDNSPARTIKIVVLCFALILVLISLYYSIKTYKQRQRLRAERLALAEGRAVRTVTIPVDQLEKGPDGQYIAPKQVLVPAGQYENKVDAGDAANERIFGAAARREAHVAAMV